ncbi:alpha/beta hydrolase family protein [Streptosporangium sandarakinum]|uniref:alpha/beta hydrolase family protein n=1 Tax=Streptosporangium sandarakinum TaxID=1260955 RepID=UPI003D8BC117
MPDVIPLPERTERITASLPDPFRRSQLDGDGPAFALTPAGPVVSADAWSGRHLALLTGGRWTPLTAGPRWHRRPRWDGERLTADVSLDLAAERFGEETVPLPVPVPIPAAGREPSPVPGPAGRGGKVVHPVLGEVLLPPRAVVEAVVPDSPRRDRIAVLLRRGPARRVVCVDGGGVSHWDGPVTSVGPWLSPEEVVVVAETWPGRAAYAWHTRTGARRRLTGPGAAVVGDVLAGDGIAGLSWTSAGQPRRLWTGESAELAAGGLRLRPDPPRGQAPPPARHTVLQGPCCPLPCLLRDPPGTARGTVLLLHGGPNGVNLGTWSPFAESLALAGWRVVQPNVRGSNVLDPALRPPPPGRYGVDDADDVLAVLRQVATGPVVAGGMSYGGYLAARVAHLSPRVSGVFLLGGFLRFTDLGDSGHDGVRAFLRTAGDRLAPDAAPAAVPHFVAHGEEDPRIPAGAVRAHLGELPAGSEWVGIEGEGHGMLTDHAARKVFPRFFAWLDGLG